MADDSDQFSRNVDDAANKLTDLANFGARESASAIEEAFERAGRAIETSLARAARSGELSFEAMAQSILRSLSRLAIDRFVAGPLSNALSGALKAAPLFGARAVGGPVTPGGSYLVGERGPELFTPASAGSLSRSARAGVTVNVHIGAGADAEDIRRSQGQIAAAVARAVARGRRDL